MNTEIDGHMDYIIRDHAVSEAAEQDSPQLEPIGIWIARIVVWLVMAPLSAGFTLFVIYQVIKRLAGF